MLLSKILRAKKFFTKKNGDQVVDLISSSYDFEKTGAVEGFIRIQEDEKMRPDLVSVRMYSDQSKWDSLLKYNGIQWSTLSLNFAQLGSGECVEKFNNELFCGGDFSCFNFFPGIDSAPTLVNYLAKLQNTVSIEQSNPNDYRIAPNPALSYITIEVDKLINESFIICDQLGRTVITGKLNGISTEVNLSSLSKGIYTLKIEGNYQPAQIVKE